MAKGLIPMLLWGCGVAQPVAHSALLVTFDTTRADALAGFGGDASVSPRFAELLEESTLFHQARTVCPVTLPAHASMLTGLLPPRHGLRDNGLASLSESAETVAEIVSRAGLETAAFVSASVLDQIFGLAQGFDVYDQPARPKVTGGPIVERSAADTVAAARNWLEGIDPDQRFFLWVHLYDPHPPYRAEAKYVEQAGGRAYHGEVAAADAALGTLLDALRSLDLFEDTLLVVVADHGEGLGEHGEPAHGALCYESTMRVPLLVRRPGGEAGESDAFVSVVDVHPTLLGGLGLEPAPGLDGADLFDPTALRIGTYFEAMSGYINYGWSPLAGWVDRDGKYLHSSRPELYHLGGDPKERVDLSLVEVKSCERARRRISELLTRPALEPASFPPDRELLLTLRSLGYAGHDAGLDRLPSPLARSDRPSPRDRIDEMNLLLRGHRQVEDQRYPEAVATLAELVQDNPLHTLALDLLGFAFMNLERFEEAAASYERLLALGVERADALMNLGVAYERLGKRDRAMETYRRLLQADPSSAEAREGMLRLGSS